MKPSTRLPVLLLCVSVNAAQASHDLFFTFTTRQPIVQVSVNGGAAVPFVVDTGATIHLVDEDLGNDLLRNFVVTVDYRRRTLVLEKPGE